MILDPGTGTLSPSAADMEAVYFGVAVGSVGEDGDMLALGHHDPRLVLAALNRYCRLVFGWVNFADNRSASAADALADLKPCWAVFTPPNLADGDDPDSPWFCRWTSDETTPGAVPITLYRS